jgi:hypothetical protein
MLSARVAERQGDTAVAKVAYIVDAAIKDGAQEGSLRARMVPELQRLGQGLAVIACRVI